ncbi:hypothetical protein IPN35_01940 [Candidatus Peregrinibacteria bacterium]|nr:MAG: hypothetical protein IPN35_01940 [Candidatus Peregrinibacteria bacterium]
MLSTELKREFDRLADTLELLGENPFRVRAYRKVALLITELGEHDLHTMTLKELENVSGIGEAIGKKILEYRETGHISALDQEAKKIPLGLFDLLNIPNVGPKTVRTLWQKLGVINREMLIERLHSGAVAGLFGFGEKKTERIISGLHLLKKADSRISRERAETIAMPLFTYLQHIPEVEKVEICGSFRRKSESIGDLDFLVQSRAPQSVISAFLQYPDIQETLAHGTTKASVRLEEEGRQVDLRVVPPESFGAALQYFTGSKEHNILVRQKAQKRGLKLSEYGLFEESNRIAGETEEGIYRALGLKMPLPEHRIGKDELIGVS